MKTFMSLSGNIMKEFGGLDEYNLIDGKNRIKEAFEAFITRGEQA